MPMLESRTDQSKNSFSKRIFLLLVFVFIFVGLIFMRLFNLQVVNRGFYQAQALGQHGVQTELKPTRGEIYMAGRGENLLVATNLSTKKVYVVPKDISDPVNLAHKLAPFLEMKPKEITDRIASGSQSYTLLKKQVSEETASQIKDLDLVGVGFENETVRFYPEQDLASHILGFLGFKGNERVGQYGIEGRFERSLAGSAGIIGLEKDVAGRWITFASRNLVPATNGDSVYLTIDPAIQFKSQEVLEKTVKAHGAEGGSVIVLNPKTGAITAMANYPKFNPNEYSKVKDISVYSNRALALDYEPGSIFKPLTMAAALNEGKINADTEYEDLGVLEFPENIRIRNSDNEAHGVQTMSQVLEKSLNTGVVFVEQQLGHEKFKEYVNTFGFGKLTDVELPGEVLGNLDNLNKKGDIFFATASFGQGITVTPLQIVKAFTAIANGGKLMKPYVVSKLVHPDETEEQYYPKEEGQVITPKTAATVSAMMVNVVEHGHGKKAGVPGYYIAGKTGTAQVPFKDRPGYDPSKNIGSFVGFGPVDDPAFVMLVRIDHPKDVKFAESTAAPAFGEIAQFILNYLQIPPTRQ